MACERCSRPLPYPDDPFRPKPPPKGRYPESWGGPIRITKGDLREAWFCSTPCFQKAHAKPKTPKEKRREKTSISIQGSKKTKSAA